MQRHSNRETIRGIAKILKEYRSIRCEVRGETGKARSAPRALARYLSLREVEDVDLCMEALARERANACVTALIDAGCPPRQLFATWRGQGDFHRVDFRPEQRLPARREDPMAPPLPDEPWRHRENRRTTDTQWGPRHLPPRLAPTLRNVSVGWAERDLRDAVRKFPRLEEPSALREWLVAVSRRPEGGADLAIFLSLFCDAPASRATAHGPYVGSAPTTLADLLHFDCARLAKLGVCDHSKARTLAEELEKLRRAITSAFGRAKIDPAAVREARSRIREILDQNEVRFDGAGDERLESIEQAWSIDHTDAGISFQNREVIEAIGDVLAEYAMLRIEVHGETGVVQTAPERLANHLGLHPLRDVKAVMDALARLRAEACLEALVEYGVPRSQMYVTALGQGGKIQVDFLPEGAPTRKLLFGHVPLRFVRASSLTVDGWRTMHLAINCHFDPLPDRHCTHTKPCRHREHNCDHPRKLSVRSFEGKRADYALSDPAVKPKRPENYGRGDRGARASSMLSALGGGPRGVYEEGVVSAFFSSTRTPNPHVGDNRLGPLSWKTSLMWREARRYEEAGLLLWCDACCLDQEAISRGLVGAERYAEAVLAALEECDWLWVHISSDYSSSLFTVLELLVWHAWKGIHPTNTRLLNNMRVANVAGRSARIAVFDPLRDHAAWLRAAMRKHGAVAKAYAHTFLSKAGIDIADADAVREAFDALTAIAASAEQQDPALAPVQPEALSWYAPLARLVEGAGGYEHGFVARPKKELMAAGKAVAPHPPMSAWTRSASARVPPSFTWLHPGLTPDAAPPAEHWGGTGD